MTTRTTRHLTLFLIVLLWAIAVVQSLEYVGRFWFHYFFVSVKWLQYLFITLSLYAGWLLALGMRLKAAPGPLASGRPFVSILVPCKDEAQVIEGTLRSLAALDYHADGERRFEIIVVDDGSRDGTPQIVDGLQAELGVHMVRTPAGSRGKAAALNVGLRRARGDLLAFFDADARIAPDFLRRMVGAMEAEGDPDGTRISGPRLVGVQGRRLPLNGGANTLTRMQEDEFGIVLTLFQRARDAWGAFVNFAGNGMLLRREALEQVGGWNEEALTEDIDLSIRFHLRGWVIRYREDAVVWEEAVRTLPALIRQRIRWFEGALRCLGEHLPAILTGRMPMRVRIDIIFFLAGGLLATLALLTTYAYALMRLPGVVVLFLQVPRWIMAATSVLFTLTLVGAVVERRGWRAATLLSVLVRFGLFSLHRLIVVPLAMYRYVRSAVTGRVEWIKTAHLGEAAPERAPVRFPT